MPLISQGAAADPIFGTAVVAGGGTGRVTLTNHGVLVGAGTSAITQLSVGATGTVLIGSTGADPVFSATPSVTSITFGAGTALSVYQEGTFTPGFAFGGAAVGITYTVQQGNYTKIGNVVIINIRLAISSKGSSTGTATITGLPFTNGSGILTGIPVNSFGGLTFTATYTNLSLSMDASANTATLLASSGAAGGTSINVTDAMFANAVTMRVSASYLIV